ncbi:MAG: hypothetical protein Q8O76_12105 [Chloroflexota bacterium]|nr:hypothetical protein [Chloroflexota bacterium]
MGLPKPIWEKWSNREEGDGYHWENYETDYLNWLWKNPKARERLELIAHTANRHRKRDVYIGCYCRDMPCHRFTLLAFMAQVYKVKVDPLALQKYGQYEG